MRYVTIALISFALSASAFAGEFGYKSHSSSSKSYGYSSHSSSYSTGGSGFGWRLGYSSSHGFDSGAFISFVFGAPVVTHTSSYYSTSLGHDPYLHYRLYRPDCYISNGYYYRDPTYSRTSYSYIPYRSSLIYDRYYHRPAYPYLDRYSSRYDDRFSYKRHTSSYPNRYDRHTNSTRYYHSDDWNRTGTRPLNQHRDNLYDRAKIDSSRDRTIREIERRVEHSRAERERAFYRLQQESRTRIRVDNAYDRPRVDRAYDNSRQDRSRLDRATIRYQTDRVRVQGSGDRQRVIFNNARTREGFGSRAGVNTGSAARFGSRAPEIVNSRPALGNRAPSFGSRASSTGSSRPSLGGRASASGPSRVGSRR